MRGHWISETRKLNKHYQDGGAGAHPPTPSYWQWGNFLTCAGDMVNSWRHLEGVSQLYGSGNGEYYSIQPYSFNTLNFAGCCEAIGYHNADGSFKYMDDPSSSSVLTQLYREWIEDSFSKREIGKFSNYDGRNRNYTEENSFNGKGYNFVKFKFPKRDYYPPYYDRMETIPESIISFVARNQELSSLSLEMNSKACKAAWFPTTTEDHSNDCSNNQNVNFVQTFYSEGVEYKVPTAASLSSMTIENIYDRENAGLDYVEFVVNIYPCDESGERMPEPPFQAIARIYCFIYNEEYYVDQRIHLFDMSNQPLHNGYITTLTYFSYPFPLSGYLYNSAYTLPYPSETIVPGYEDPNACFYRLSTAYVGQRCDTFFNGFSRDAVFKMEGASQYYQFIAGSVQNQTSSYSTTGILSLTRHGLMAITLSEQEFEDAKAAWEALHPPSI